VAHPRLHLVSLDKSVDIHIDMGDGPATPTAGFSGHETVSRVRKKGMTAFVGVPPFAQDVPVMLDGFRENRSVQRTLEALEALGGATRFRAFGPIHHEGDIYIFGDEPEFGEAIRAEDGTLIRQRLTLKLEEYVSADQVGREVGGDGKVGQAIPLTYTTSKGDTLEEVAFRLYHDKSRWKEIGQKNGIANPLRALPAGRALKL
jgi:hypothetical protein